jgi:tRNA G18 (ribose-2'-O)-methylase SpoU
MRPTSAPSIADYRDVTDDDRLRSHGLFVAEGRLIVRRVIEGGRCTVRSVLVNASARRDLDDVFARLSSDVPVYEGDASTFAQITGIDFHRGCLALVERPPAISIETILSFGGTIVVLEGVTNADNIGGVFRNAAALGASGVILSPTCCDPLYRKAVRTSMGTVLRLPYVRVEDWPAAFARCRSGGFTVVALTPREPSEPIDAFGVRVRGQSRGSESGVGPRTDQTRLALLIGTEGDGLTPEAERAADVRVRIPMRRDVDSLNLAVAAGIALYELSLKN